jgi:hypothetical protein
MEFGRGLSFIFDTIAEVNLILLYTDKRNFPLLSNTSYIIFNRLTSILQIMNHGN